MTLVVAAQLPQIHDVSLSLGAPGRRLAYEVDIEMGVVSFLCLVLALLWSVERSLPLSSRGPVGSK